MRKETWQALLHAEIEAARGRPFVWGTHDCCLFVARLVDVMTGSGHAATLQDEYHDEAGAREYLERHGSLEGAVSAWLGPRQPANWAGPGDVVLSHLEEGATLGLCLGLHNAYAGPTGIAYRPRTLTYCCWRI